LWEDRSNFRLFHGNVFGDGHTACDVQSAVSRPQDGAEKPALTLDGQVLVARESSLGTYRVYCESDAPWLFTDNETNTRRLFGQDAATGHFKDAFHEFVVAGQRGAVCPEPRGTKAAAHHRLLVPPGAPVTVRLRLSSVVHEAPFAGFDTLVARQQSEADGFYGQLQHGMSADEMGMMTADEMHQLEQATGADFDRIRVQQMIKHHQGALTMARTRLDQGENADAKTLAQQILGVQEAEITEMQALS